MTAGITAKDPYSFDNGSGGNTVTIAAGGTVTFSYPSGASSHNVVFDPAQPTSCHDIPPSASPPGWSGSCTFEAYGTYTFHCSLHSFMTGTVEVPDPNTPTTGTTGPPPTEHRRSATTGRRGAHVTSREGGRQAARRRRARQRDHARRAFGHRRYSTRRAERSRLAARRVKIGSVSRRSTGTGRPRSPSGQPSRAAGAPSPPSPSGHAAHRGEARCRRCVQEGGPGSPPRAELTARHEILYDPDCGFCRVCVALVLSWDRSGRLRPVFLRAVRERNSWLGCRTPSEWPPGTSPSRTGGGSVPENGTIPHHLDERPGVWSAGAAFSPLFRLLPGGAPLARLTDRFPGAAERGYRCVADRPQHVRQPIPAGVKRWADRVIAERLSQNLGPMADD